MSQLRVLLVDDDELVRWSISEILKRRGDQFDVACDGPEALAILKEKDFDVLITDLAMPEMSGLELVHAMREIRPQVVSIVLTGLGTRDDVITAIHEGVFDFIDKPIPDIATFSMAIDRAGDRAQLVRERDQLLQDLKVQNTRLEVSLSQLNDAYDKLRQQDRAMAADLQQAQRMHQRLLPAEFPRLPGLDFFGYFRPCERLAGDFFGAIPLSDSQVALYLADVAGHGVGAAMVTVIIRELIHAHRMLYPESRVFEHPTRALHFINRGLLEEEFDPPILVTMVYVVVNAMTGDVIVGTAGHPPPILVKEPGSSAFLPSHGTVLGIESPTDFVTARFKLSAGDFLLMYSDGLSEARDAQGRELTEQGLARAVEKTHGATASEVGSGIQKALTRYQQHGTPEDDETFLVVARTDLSQPLTDSEDENVGIDRGQVKIDNSISRTMTLPSVPARVLAGWTDSTSVVGLEGKSTWCQGPSVKAAITHGLEEGAESVHLDLKHCEFLDSTILGILYEFSTYLTIHAPSERVLFQLREMGIEGVFRFTQDELLGIELEEKWIDDPGEEEHASIILSAHEALMAVSEKNRLRFSPAVRMMRKKRDK
jgi:phosphoserine phosphatase RsbU/P